MIKACFFLALALIRPTRVDRLIRNVFFLSVILFIIKRVSFTMELGER